VVTLGQAADTERRVEARRPVSQPKGALIAGVRVRQKPWVSSSLFSHRRVRTSVL
jgi:hypothetical protein